MATVTITPFIQPEYVLENKHMLIYFSFLNDEWKRSERVPNPKKEKIPSGYYSSLSSRNKVHWGNQGALLGEPAFW